MAVLVQKSAVNIREKLAELERPIGVNGQSLMATNTPQDAFSLIGARNRNRIINGDMRIDQRNAGGAVTTADGFSVDRWQHAYNATNSTASIQRVTDAPIRFTNSLRYTVTSAASPLANSSSILHRIEGFNVSDLRWGTSNASPITLSFWVKSSLTGNFGGSVTNGNFDRTYPFPYTISSPNTWEYKTITIPGDTTGTWNTDNTIGIQINFSLGAASAREATANVWANTVARQPTGSVNLISTNGATWQITGVQLEEGRVSTPFEHRSYGQELALCQRYYCQSTNSVEANSLFDELDGVYMHAFNYSNGLWAGVTANFPVSMRTTPSTIQVFTANPATTSTAGNVSHYQAAIAWGTCPIEIHLSTCERFLSINAAGAGRGSTGSSLVQFNYTASAEL